MSQRFSTKATISLLSRTCNTTVANYHISAHNLAITTITRTILVHPPFHGLHTHLMLDLGLLRPFALSSHIHGRRCNHLRLLLCLLPCMTQCNTSLSHINQHRATTLQLRSSPTSFRLHTTRLRLLGLRYGIILPTLLSSPMLLLRMTRQELARIHEALLMILPLDP